jgi:excinuclease ABC subunit A
VRKLFAATPAARRRKYKAGRFSFNVAQGRCDTCDGEGSVSVELLFMPSAYAPCPACKGARYNAATLEVRWKGHTIAETWASRSTRPAVSSRNRPMCCAHCTPCATSAWATFGWASPRRSCPAGEAQRIKLATELQRSPRGSTLYVLDEPTTGLHPADVDSLFSQLDQLVRTGHSVVMVEHEMRIVARCDWVIDMGPGAGDDGGRIVAEGPPARVGAAGVGATGAHLRRHLAA